MDLGATEVEIGLLLRNPAAHVLDDGGVLALQALELHQLLGQIAPADVDDTPGLLAQTGNTSGDRRPENLLTLPHDAVCQRVFEPGQAAGFEQLGIVGNLGHQAFVCRDRNYLVLRNSQNVGGRRPLPVDLRLNL